MALRSCAKTALSPVNSRSGHKNPSPAVALALIPLTRDPFSTAMSREVQQIPPAPRELHWDAVLWHLWPLALLGLGLAVYGGLWTLMLYFASGGKPSDDIRLDQSAAITEGRVASVMRTGASYRGEAQDWLSYSFDNGQGHHQEGRCFARASAVLVGHAVEVEFLEQDPHINRVHGGRISLLADYVGPAFSTLVLPGILVLLCWGAAVWRLRQILRHGDVAVAEILDATRLYLVIPNMLSVHYSFRDRHAKLRTGWHWLRERSQLGERLSAGDERLAVIHDRRRPGHSRLVYPAQFLNQLREP